MSRIFEVLERVQQEQELFCVPPVTKEAPAIGTSTGKFSLPDMDAFTREEVLKLVRHLFWGADGNVRRGPRRVVFCGVDKTDGSNLICALAGRTLAQQVQAQVCVVDANSRMCASRSLFDVAWSDSSTQSESRTPHRCLRQVTDNLWLVSGNPLAANGGIPHLEQVRVWIKELGDEFAYVLINAPPAGLYSDAGLLGQIADGVVLVLEANSTRRMAARTAKRALEGANVPILGTVLNDRTFPIPERIYRML
jgi:hypothetical protein